MSLITAQVNLWGNYVGALALDGRSGFATFEYSSEWLKNGVEISPIHMPLASRKYVFPGLNPDTFKGLPAVFADSLPDDFGNAVINAWLAGQGRSPQSFSSLERLLYTGKKGMGALEYAPAMKKRGRNPRGAIEIDSLVRMAQRILDQRAGLVVTPDSDTEPSMKTLFQLGTSAGGARAKAIVAINRNRTSIRSGQLSAPEGYEHYLLKFDGVSEKRDSGELFSDPKGFGRMEYACYLMAVDSGVDISESDLLKERKRAHFITKRFDRNGNEKRHYLSLCGMDHADFKKPGFYSYEELFSLARRLRLTRHEAIEIFRRMVFNVICRNQDDHAKNAGFLMERGTGKWRLAPAFDLAYSYRKDSPWVASHQMSINGKRNNFTRHDLQKAGTSCIGNFSVRDADRIIDQVIEVAVKWDEYAERTGVFSWLQQEIKKNLRIKL